MTDTTTAAALATLGEIVTADPSAARVLESFWLDYCCGGQQRLDVACASAGVAVDAVVAALGREVPGTQPDWATMTPPELVDHIESVHHGFLHAELPRLDALAQKVAGVHGRSHPELMEVLADLAEVRDDLEPHLRKEEQVLFPAIRRHVPGRSLAAPIQVMLAEHDVAGDLLERLRRSAGDYVVPDDGCASYRALYDGLLALERDTHLHIHKENNVLFPALLASSV
jgi:regulator of cell morphogenesis and NO signaling